MWGLTEWRKTASGCNSIFMVFLLGILVAHYLQSLSPALALGGELVYHRRPGEEGTVTSLVGRYTGKNQTPHVWTWGGELGCPNSKLQWEIKHFRTRCSRKIIHFMVVIIFKQQHAPKRVILYIHYRANVWRHSIETFLMILHLHLFI